MKTRWILPAVCVGLAALFAFPVAQADRDDDDNGDNLVGTWRFTVPTPVGTFFDYLVFHEDNTLTEMPSFGSFVSMGSGVWEEIDDDDDDSDSDHANFAVTFESFNDDDGDTAFDSRNRVRLTLQVEGDTLTGTGTTEIRTLDNSALIAGPFPGSTFQATRMKVIPQ